MKRNKTHLPTKSHKPIKAKRKKHNGEKIKIVIMKPNGKLVILVTVAGAKAKTVCSY